MNPQILDWSFPSFVLLWFVTTLAQVTLLTCLVLLITRCLKRQTVVKHCLLTATLALIAITPWSTLGLQRAGMGLLAITDMTDPLNPVSSDVLVDTEASPKKTQIESPKADDANVDPQNPNQAHPLLSHDEPSTALTAHQPLHAIAPTATSAAGPVPIADAKTSLQQSRSVSSQRTTHALMRNKWWRNLLTLVAITWWIGCSVMAIRWMVAWKRLRQLLAHAKPVNAPDLESAYVAACRLTGSNQQAVRLVTSLDIATPVVAGMLRPAIVIPETLLGTISQPQLVQIFVHELAHIARRDQWLLALQQLAKLLFWAHPLVHRVCHRLTQASEEICDNYVLTQSSTNAYSQTLLVVAELATRRQNPLGTIGLVGGWSLTDRIAGLLDKRRERATCLRGRARLGVGCLVFGFSIVLLLNGKPEVGAANAQESVARVETPDTGLHDGIRGTGDQLEFRVRGKLLSQAKKPLVNPTVSITESGNDQIFHATVVDDRYEVWLPAKSFRWLSLLLEAKSEDGRRGVVIIGNSGLRQAIDEGFDILLQHPTRTIKVLVKHNAQPVANAHVKLFCINSPKEELAISDSKGEAIFKVNGNCEVSSLTAWTESGLLGGYQTYQRPERDPKAVEHVVELFACQPRKVHVVVTDGSPVEGVRLKLHVATLDHYNYLGHPTGAEVVTDSTGTANYQWFPMLEGGVHHYADLKDGPNWQFHSQRKTDDAVEVVVAKPAKRVKVEGQVSRGGKDVSGIVVQAHSFQGEQKGRSDVLMAIADQEGNFCFDAFPESTYSLMVMDDQWVSVPKVFTPVDPKTDEKQSPYLMAGEGQPVTIQLTSGPDRNPIAGQSVTLVSEHSYSWLEDGEKRNGTTHRQIFATTDSQGLARAIVPLGPLRANVYTSAWRSEAKSVIAVGKENRLTLHRGQDTTTTVAGTLVLPSGSSLDLNKVSLRVQAIDGQLSEEFTPTVNGSGEFHFDTKAAAVGCFAYSADGQWAGSQMMDDLSQPLRITLHPTAYLSGQLLDGEGKPVAHHQVHAETRLENPNSLSSHSGFSMSMKGKPLTAMTDQQGKYRIGPLPRQVEIGMWCKPTNATADQERESLGTYFIELDEKRPPQIHRLGPEPDTPSQSSAQERIAEVLRDARLGNFHAMVLLTNFADESCSRFVQEEFLDYDSNTLVTNYMHMHFNTQEPISEKKRAFATERNWPLPPAGSVAALALDADGKELGRAIIDITTKDARKNAVAFIEAHSPPRLDAQQKWDDAFALAKTSGRRVWARIGQRYCAPCHHLNRWLDDHRELLEKEFVMLKIDDIRDLNGTELAKEITAGKPFSIPFYAFYDGQQERLVTSEGPLGNIGFASGFDSKRHFRKMLATGNSHLTEDDIEELLASLED